MVILLANPFINSFREADWIGKLIYCALFLLSVITWAILVHKLMLTRQAKTEAMRFQEAFKTAKSNPLHLEYSIEKDQINPLYAVYTTIKNRSLEVLNKNRHFAKNPQNPSYLSEADIDFIDSHADTSIDKEVQKLDQHVYMLSTVVTLAPFLGLLGTVWGILVTFTGLQASAEGGSSQMILSGLALALTTTILGLVVAIPALIGYNYLKNTIKNLEHEMANFSQEMVASVELQYRQVDIQP